MFYIENKDDISEDLLADFKDPDNENKFLKPKVLNKQGMIDKSKLEKQVIVKQPGLVSEHDYLFGLKGAERSTTIDV